MDHEKDYYRHMVTERHRIWVARQNNEPQPWTEDPVLSRMKMTNMFRVLDPGSQFVFDLDTPDPVDVIARLVFYRMTNLPATWEMLKVELGDYPKAMDFIHQSAVLFQTIESYRKRGNKVFSGAYIIVPEPGTMNNKVGGALRVARTFVQKNAEEFLNATTQAERFAVLKSTLGIGPFLSMQILTDWGYLQAEEPDLEFVVAGPGARRGAAIICATCPPERLIAEKAEHWFDDPFVRLGNRGLTAMDVQNTFCEFGKMVRYTHGGKPIPKNLYRPAHPGVQPPPILPQWW